MTGRRIALAGTVIATTENVGGEWRVSAYKTGVADIGPTGKPTGRTTTVEIESAGWPDERSALAWVRDILCSDTVPVRTLTAAEFEVWSRLMRRNVNLYREQDAFRLAMGALASTAREVYDAVSGTEVDPRITEDITAFTAAVIGSNRLTSVMSDRERAFAHHKVRVYRSLGMADADMSAIRDSRSDLYAGMLGTTLDTNAYPDALPAAMSFSGYRLAIEA